jgi:hypothetical protein
MYTKKEVAVQISKQRCTLGSYKGDVFSVRKQYFFTLKTLLAPHNALLDVEIGLHRPLLQTYVAV